jgi:hypothetical protein
MGVQASSHGSVVRARPVPVKCDSNVSNETHKIDRNSVLIRNSPLIVNWIWQLVEEYCQKLQAHSDCAVTLGLILGIVKTLTGKWRPHDDTLNLWLIALSVPQCEIPSHIRPITCFDKSL